MTLAVLSLDVYPYELQAWNCRGMTISCLIIYENFWGQKNSSHVKNSYLHAWEYLFHAWKRHFR